MTMLTKTDFERILGNISYHRQEKWHILLRYDKGGPFLQIEDNEATDNFGGAAMSWRGRKWDLSPHMCVSEVIRTAFKAIQTAEEHELSECFRYKGVALFDPHRNLDLLVELGSNVDALDTRDNRTMRVPELG